MEKKTIGSFIATLRKASGLTQKQLAEMLLVTDKTVSRWERDETLPDLTLIPVIAEIFGVTSDELLRGERKAPNITSPIDGSECGDGGKCAESEAENKRSASAALRSEKQLRRILRGTEKAYQARSLISYVISVVGVILTFTCIIGISISSVDEYAIGCALGLIANLVTAVYQRVGTINAMAAINSEEFVCGQINEIKKAIIQSETAVMMTVIINSAVILWAGVFENSGIEGWIFFLLAACICWIISYSAKERIKKTNSTFEK